MMLTFLCALRFYIFICGCHVIGHVLAIYGQWLLLAIFYYLVSVLNL